MHVGRGPDPFAQARRLEGMIRRLQAQDGSTTLVLARQADVVEGFIGEAPALMAGCASGFADKESEARNLVRLQSAVVAFHPSVEPGFRRNERSLKGRESLCQVGLCHARIVRERG